MSDEEQPGFEDRLTADEGVLSKEDSRIGLLEAHVRRLESDIGKLCARFDGHVEKYEAVSIIVGTHTHQLAQMAAAAMIPTARERSLSTTYTTIIALVGFNITLTIGTLALLIERILTTPR